MKEKKIAIVVLLSMVLQAEAAIPMLKNDHTDDAKVEKKSKKQPMKKEKEASKGKHERKHEGGHHEGGHHEGGHKDEPKKEEHKKEAKHVRMEHQDKKKKDASEKQEKIRNNKRVALKKRINGIEKQIRELEDQLIKEKRSVQEEASKDSKVRDHRIVLHHDNESAEVKRLTREIKQQKELLTSKEDALVKLSEDVQVDKHKEAANRRALAKAYDATRTDLRADLTKVEDQGAKIRAEEIVLKNKLEDDKAGYEQHIVARRHAETRYDSTGAQYQNKAMLVTESDRMKVKRLQKRRVREDLDKVGKKIRKNDKARKELAKELGTKDDLKKEKHDKHTDQMIKESVKTRPLTQNNLDIKERQKELDRDRDMMSKKEMGKKGMRMKRPMMPMNDADQDMSRMMMEDKGNA